MTGMDDSGYKARAAALQALGRKVAAHLGANVWTFDAENGYEHAARLVAGNVEIWINNSHKRGMYHVSGSHSARDSHKHWPYNAKRPEINVSQEKTPAQVARDIERRLLPATRAFADEIQKRIDSANAHVNATTANAQALAAATGGEVAPLNQYRSEDGSERIVKFGKTLPGSYITATVRGGHVTIERLSLTPAQAAAVIKTLASVWISEE